MPEPFRGSAFSEEVIRHSSIHGSTPTLGSETEIVHIGRRSQKECALITVIGARSQRALWDSIPLWDSYPMTATIACTLNTKQNSSQAV